MEIEELAAQFNIPTSLDTPPVHTWNPPLSGEMDMVIKANGQWIHEGGEIKRKELVRLFASILKQEGDEYFLVTPVEKWKIQVEDTPLHISGVHQDNGAIHCTVLSGGVVTVSDEHELIMNTRIDDAPKIQVRNGLCARFLRNAFYTLTSESELHEDRLIVKSKGATFTFPLFD